MDKRATRRQRGQDERKDKTVVFIDNSRAELLRALAADLGYFTTRGPRVGNIHALIERIADAVERDPDALRRLLEDDTDDAQDALAA